MRTAFVLAALAATAFAAPRLRKRDVVVVVETETDIVWVTQVVTVTADPAIVIAPQTAAQATTSAGGAMASGFFNHDVNSFDVPILSTYAVLTSPTSTTRAAAQTTSIALPPPILTSIVAPPPVSTTSIILPPPAATSNLNIPDPLSFPPVFTSSSQAETTTDAVPPPATSTAQATTTSSTQTSTTTSTQAASAKPTTYQELVIAHHNLHRRNHSAPDMVWDAGLANAAATIASSCKYAHNTDVDRNVIGGYGQNIAAGVGADNISLIITELFYNGEVNYYDGLYGQDQPDMSEFEHWGHFSQIVWRETTKVGCATQHCDSLSNVGSNVPPHFTVCNYQAPGNVEGEYTEVGASLHLPTAHWNYFL